MLTFKKRKHASTYMKNKSIIFSSKIKFKKRIVTYRQLKYDVHITHWNENTIYFNTETSQNLKKDASTANKKKIYFSIQLSGVT